MAAVYLAEVDDPCVRRTADELMLERGLAGAARLDFERRLPLFEQYRASLPEFVQRRHADALEAAKAKAVRGIAALRGLYGR